MRDKIEMTNEEIEAAFEEIGACATVSEEYGCDVVFTTDTIADFVSAADDYNEYSSIEDCGDHLIIHDAQVRKGETRADVFVIDFGEVRGVWK